jgi:hypothetical protein
VSDVVDRVLDALNAKDVEAFVACYAEGATIEDGYDSVRARGHDAIRALYTAMLERFPELHVEPGRRTVAGEFVVQQETVTGRLGHEQHVAVYQVTDGVVVRERLLA